MKRLQVLLLVLLPAGMLWAAEDEVINHPGYVDFSSLTAITAVQPNIEVSLKTPLLRIITNLIRHEDEEAADFVSRLVWVTVNVFESDAIDVEEVTEVMDGISLNLDSEGWERVVRVRDDHEHADIYFRLSEAADMVYGVAIMASEPGETVLVNIVGNISTDDLSALGRRFDIDELVALDEESN